jgi:hypothetical protein
LFLICCTVLNLLVRKGKGPEGRKNLAQGASPGSRKPSCSREPQRGERIRFRPGISPWVCRPFRGWTGVGGLVSQGSRPGLSSIARLAGSGPPCYCVVSFCKYVMHQWQDSNSYVAHPEMAPRLPQLAHEPNGDVNRLYTACLNRPRCDTTLGRDLKTEDLDKSKTA